MAKNLLLSLKNLLPPTSTDSAAERILIDTCNYYLLPSKSSLFDYEDYFEDAMRLKAGVDVFGPGRTWYILPPNDHFSIRDKALNLENRKVSLLTEITDSILIGASLQIENRLLSNKVNKYMFSGTFQKYCGRKQVVAGVTDNVGEVLQEAELTGKLFVKGIQSKSGIWRTSYQEDMKSALIDVMDWAGIRLEGLEHTLLIQEDVEMTHEMRCFVVNGKIVTSAGCIELHTPFNNQEQFNPYFEKVRNASPVTKNTDVRDQLLEFGEQVVKDFIREQKIKNFVLDLCLINGSPAVVEFNDLASSGLYGSQPHRVMEALKTS